MNTFEELLPISTQPIELTIGNFDGVHLGHQTMLKQLVSSATSTPCVMTFSPHPKCKFQSCDNFLITDTKKRLSLIKETGIKNCWLIPFTTEFCSLSPIEFIEKLKEMNVKSLTLGSDFNFGHKGTGNIDLLKEHFHVNIIDTLCDESGNRISSSNIRKSILSGDFLEANALLGRLFSYSGTVIHGQKIGRTLNFPTANLSVEDERLMPSGVYASHIEFKEKTYQGITNCGRRPTVGEFKNRLLETYIFDFKEDLYGEEITIIPKIKIRDEKKFASINQLKQQIEADTLNVKAYFKNSPT